MAQRTVTVPEYVVTDRVEVKPKTTALLIVDMQNDFVKEGGKLVVPTAKDTIPAIRKLLVEARLYGMFVAYTQDSHLPNDPEFPIWGLQGNEPPAGSIFAAHGLPSARDGGAPQFRRRRRQRVGR